MNDHDAPSAMQMATAERRDLAALLAELAPAQWEHRSLCALWQVRDVAAHVVSYDQLDPPAVLRRLAEAKLSPSRANQIGVEHARPLTTAQLVDSFRQHSRPRGLAASYHGMIGLSDAVIHHQDIRRPLGLARTIPPERLRAVLNYVRFAPLMRGPWRVHGLSLEATDIDWRSGHGAPLRGPGEALLMAIAGRADALADLAGAGKNIIAKRI